MESNQLAVRPSVYGAGRLPRTNPEPQNEKSRLGFPGGFPLKIQCKSAPLALQTSHEHWAMRMARLTIAFAIPGGGGFESYAQHDSSSLTHLARTVNK